MTGIKKEDGVGDWDSGTMATQLYTKFNIVTAAHLLNSFKTQKNASTRSRPSAHSRNARTNK